MQKCSVFFLAVMIWSAAVQAAADTGDIDALIAAYKSGATKSCRELAAAIQTVLPTASVDDLTRWAVGFEGVPPTKEDIPIRLALASRLPDQAVGKFEVMALSMWMKGEKLAGVGIVKIIGINGSSFPEDIKSLVRILPGEYLVDVRIGVRPRDSSNTSWGKVKGFSLLVRAGCSYQPSFKGNDKEVTMEFKETCLSTSSKESI